MRICNNGLDLLRKAILKRAIYDYKRHLKAHNKYKSAEFENWFLSDYGEWLSGGNGVFIITHCKNNIKIKTNNI